MQISLHPQMQISLHPQMQISLHPQMQIRYKKMYEEILQKFQEFQQIREQLKLIEVQPDVEKSAQDDGWDYAQAEHWQ